MTFERLQQIHGQLEVYQELCYDDAFELIAALYELIKESQ